MRDMRYNIKLSLDHKRRCENFLLKAVKIGIFLILLTPLILGPFGLTLSAYPKAVFFRSLVEIVFIFYLLLIISDKKYLPRFSLLSWVVLGFIGILLLTTITGFNPFRSFFGDAERAEGVILHLHFLAFFLMLSGIELGKKDWFKIFKIAVGVSGVVSLAGILQKLDVWRFYATSLPGRISGTLSNPDFFGPYIVLSIFLALFVFLIEKEKDLKITWLVILILHFFTLLLSKTRGAWAALGLSLIFYFFLWFFKYSASSVWRKKIVFLVFFLSLLLLFLVINKESITEGGNHFLNRFLSIFEFSFSSRVDVWKISFRAWQEKPIFGWGPESFSYVFYKYFKADYLSDIPEGMYFDYAHNKIFNLMVSSGILGVLSWLSVLGVAFYSLFKYSFLKKKLTLILSVFLVSYFFQSLLVFDTICVYLLLFLVLAFIASSIGKRKEVGKKWRVAFALPLIFLSFFSFYFVNLKPILAASAFPKNVNYEKSQPLKAISEYNKRNKGSIYEKDFKFVIVERGLLILETTKPDKGKEIVEILYGLRDSLKKLSEKPDRRPVDTLEYLARIYERNYLSFKNPDDLLKMEEVLKEGIEFNDQRPEFYRLMGELRIIQGKEEVAKKFFRKEANLFPLGEREIEYYRSLGSAFIKIEQKKKASKYFKEAVNEIYYKSEVDKRELTFMEGVAVLFCRDLKDLENCKDIYQELMELAPSRKEIFQQHLDLLIEKYF